MFLHSTREGDHPNQIQHPENIPHPEANCWAREVSRIVLFCNTILEFPGWILCCCIVFAIAGLYAEQNTLIFKVSTSFLARILKPTHHMVNLSNESDQA